MSSQIHSVEQAIESAKQAAKKGNYKLAEELYKKVLALHPTHKFAKKALKKLGAKSTNSAEAKAQVSPSIVNELVQLYKTGSDSVLISKAQELLNKFSDSAQILNLLGATLLRNNRFSEAKNVFEKLLLVVPGSASTYNNLGVLSKKQGKMEDAERFYKLAVENDHQYVMAHFNLGAVLSELGRFSEAKKHLQLAIQINPNLTEAYNNLGNLMKDTGDYLGASKVFFKAIEIAPSSPELRNNYSMVLQELGLMHEALTQSDRAIELNPQFVDAYNLKGDILSNLGKFEDAKNVYKALLKIKPDFAIAHRMLANLTTYETKDTHIVEMESLLSELPEGDLGHRDFNFALAKAYDDIKQFDSSYKYLKQGNDFCKKDSGYNIELDRRIFDEITQIFAKFSDTPPSETSKPSRTPIFIVGMPRSGTTLLEQILGSHSSVYGAGELEFLNKAIKPMIKFNIETNGEYFTSDNFELRLKEIRTNYLDFLAQLNISSPYFTDKMPINFKWIGFAILAFPEAKFIHVSRDPMATCWSIYKNYFSGSGQNYGYDFDDLLQFYRLYRELMSFWEQRFPKSIYNINYEILTEQPDVEIKSLLDFCDLPWEQDCLSFYSSESIVRTISSQQVRKKIYKGSSQNWKQYEGYLERLKTGLRELEE